jgi:prepilin-type N-terminal cleavage/methylation domain-containing protein
MRQHAPLHRVAPAFTLIELLVAMAIGLTLLVMVVQTFRSIIKVTGEINRQTRENDMLRAGYVAALDDADFYHSEANPDPPFSKGWTRAPLTGSDPADKRHFAQVVFDARTAPRDPYAGAYPSALATISGVQALPNPNVLLPSDPRSWRRVGSLANSPWGMFAPLTYPGRPAFPDLSGMSTEQVYGRTSLAAATDMRAMPEDGSQVGAGLGATGKVDPYVNQTMPCLQAAIWQRLGYLGLWTYLRPNAPLVCLDKDGYLPGWYALTDNVGGVAQSAASPLPPFYPTTSANTPQGNYLARGGTSYHDLDGTKNGMRAPTLEVSAGLTVNLYQQGIQVKPVYPDESVQTTTSGVNLLFVSGGYKDAKDYLTVMNQRPWYGSLVGYWMQKSTVGGAVDDARTPAFLSTTYRFPGNLTDAERPTVANTGATGVAASGIDVVARPDGYPVMSTSILRKHAFLGDQITYCRVTVRVPETGRILELPFSPVCTSYRGARQHWATVTSATLATAAGDRYAP